MPLVSVNADGGQPDVAAERVSAATEGPKPNRSTFRSQDVEQMVPAAKGLSTLAKQNPLDAPLDEAATVKAPTWPVMVFRFHYCYYYSYYIDF